jgi:hypothetical protein
VGILSLSAFAALTMTSKSPEAGPVRALAGEREVRYEIDNMFWIYQKPTDYAQLGRWDYNNPGFSPYWTLREAYQEYILRSSYPFLYVYNPYSTQTTPDQSAGFVVTSWYRMYIDAKNITDIGTDPGKDPVFLPVFGNPTWPGGWVTINWYSTYLNTQEMNDIRGGTHYANTYYGVPRNRTPGGAQNDGYWHELQGRITFDRAAAHKILGLPGTDDLRTEFAAVEADIELNWLDNWLIEGGSTYDTYTAYDYSDDIRWLELLTDPESTADTLILRFWSMSWGNEVLLIRYMEAAGVWKYMQSWPDDWYLNITIGPTQGDISSRSVNGYHMTAWKDANNFISGWNIEATHMDWCGNTATHNGYPSPYNEYDPDQTDVMKVSWAPGTTRYGLEVSYWLAPQEWDFLTGESMVIELPAADVPVLGLNLYRGTSDGLTVDKRAELVSNLYWGELTLGNGYPTDMGQYYDPVARTLTLVGPIDFPTSTNSYGVLETGSPTFQFDVSAVSFFDVTISEPAPYYGLWGYNLSVTAKNQTGVTVAYNGTVTLTSTDLNILFDGSAQPVSHAYVPADGGVWTLSVMFGTLGIQQIDATDLWLPYDVTGVLVVDIVDWIPEFPTLLIPVIGAAAMFVMFGKRTRRKKA